MKNSNSKIPEKTETTMKMTTVAKASMLTAALGLACLLPATARAQSDAMPDEFAFVDTTPAAQPVLAVQAANFDGKISLPYGVNCAGKNLEPGQYVVSVRSEGSARVVTIHGGGTSVGMYAREVQVKEAASHSALLVRKSGQGHKVEAVYVEGLGATLYLNPNTNGAAAGMERLPIS